MENLIRNINYFKSSDCDGGSRDHQHFVGLITEILPASHYKMNLSAILTNMKTIQSAFQVLTTLQMTSYLFPPSALVQDGATFDYIVVGAGTAGSVIANRLTESGKNTVLLIEAGGDPPIESMLPALFPYLKDSNVDWQFKSEDDGYSQQFHKNHGCEITRGKMLGGSSALNFLLYTRGNYHDYDNWARITGDCSWSWDKVLPYFKKSERETDTTILNSPDAVYHGTDGYMGVSRVHRKEFDVYFKAIKEMGNNIVVDSNNGHPLGYSECPFTVSEGTRQSTAQAFLSTSKGRPNLFLLKNTLVTQVLFDKKKSATGVKAILSDNKTAEFKANIEVIMSAGSISTPQLLLLSGIGPAAHLKDMNINVISDLPVGQYLQDHVNMFMVHKMGKATAAKPFDPTIPSPAVLGYETLNKSRDYPDYETSSFIVNNVSEILQLCSYFSFNDDICNEIYEAGQGSELFLSYVLLLYPESRGKIYLRSTDPRDKPIIHTGYYSNPIDVDNHARYLNHFSRIKNTKYFKSVKSKLIVPKSCGCDNTSLVHEFWKCYALCMMLSGYHFAGSCPMGSVVDSRLKVIGVQKLRVADASIMPKIPGAHTSAPTIMIGEKASDIIKADFRKFGNRHTSLLKKFFKKMMKLILKTTRLS